MAKAGAKVKNHRALQIISCRTDKGKMFFFPRALKEWNARSPEIMNSKVTRASLCAQYCRYQTYMYGDAMKNSFFPWTIPRLNSQSLSAVPAQITEEIRALFI